MSAKYYELTVGICLKKIAPQQSWHVCIKIRFFFGVRFERQKVNKKPSCR